MHIQVETLEKIRKEFQTIFFLLLVCCLVRFVVYLAQVAVGLRPFLNIFGGDYPTSDGTGVRDYIHVVDLAKGHVAALEYFSKAAFGTHIFNLGRGQGCSVLGLIKAFEQVNGVKIAYKIVNRRAGDIAECYCDPSKAKKELGWVATKTIEDMCADGWLWQSKNPNGFETK